ncbi:GTP-binding protein [Burkholderia sp. S171]|uniref:CobW family GTP-binding protein n=1 Tax=Burkholderia sp. S171 TaxID=1641860 RepID=UPI00131DC6E7|nr:CobW family GTP-binding protein [Burkholderia sp. S171]
MNTASTQFFILAGILGSGKTSLLEALLDAGSGASTAVIVNEVGAINIDGAILSESARGMTMATLSNGCVCCSLTDDLVTTVEELVALRAQAGQPAFERIVLECSGLSRPGAVMRSLEQLAELRFRLLIVATYDCSRPPLDHDFDDASAQLSAAHTVVLTKIGLVSAERRAQARSVVAAINPMARIVDEFAPSIRAREAFAEVDTSVSPLIGGSEPTQVSEALLHPRVRVFRARFAEKPNWEDVLEWLENIAGMTGDRLLRMKAIVAGPHGSDRVLLQSVGTTFAAPRRLATTAFDELAAVFIVRDCAMVELQQVEGALGVTWTALQR